MYNFVLTTRREDVVGYLQILAEFSAHANPGQALLRHRRTVLLASQEGHFQSLKESGLACL
jgi:hypothetical protein